MEPEHDGQGWRLHLAPQGNQLVLTIEREVEGTWVPTQQWAEPAPEPKHRRTAITESARAHGWITPVERWPRARRDGSTVIENLFPFNWSVIVADATQMRTGALEQAGRIDTAWRATIRDAERKGLSVEQLGAISGRGRHAIYRMREGVSPVDETALLREARQEKRRG